MIELLKPQQIAGEVRHFSGCGEPDREGSVVIAVCSYPLPKELRVHWLGAEYRCMLVICCVSYHLIDHREGLAACLPPACRERAAELGS